MDSSWNWTTTESGTYRGGRELKDEAPEGFVESDLPESGKRMQGIGEGIKQMEKQKRRIWEQRRRVEVVFLNA